MVNAHSLRHWLTTSVMVGVMAGVGLMADLPKAWGSDPLPLEKVTVKTIDPSVTSRVYVPDIAISHITDGRMKIFDAAAGTMLGMVGTGFAGIFTLSPKRDEFYVATTYHSRGTRGERTDVLTTYDSNSLTVKKEMIIPPRHAQAINYRGLIRTSSDGSWVYIQNATPASSVTITDPKAGKVIGEIPTPGCWGILPAASHNKRFSTLCGDGKILTLTLDAEGKVADRQTSEKLFDPDNNAWFLQGEQIGDRYWFVSFLGDLTELDLGGAAPKKLSSVHFVNAADSKQNWRPSGFQPLTVDPTARYAVIAMHPNGGEGSHKMPAAKLWTVDIATGQKIRMTNGHNASAVNFSANGQRLHVLDVMTGSLVVLKWDGKKITEVAHTIAGASEIAVEVESSD